MKKFKHPIIFYAFSTIISWGFWLVAGMISHQVNPNRLAVTMLGFAGLVTPMLMAFWLIHQDSNLKKELWERCINITKVKPVYLFITGFLMLISILLAQAISLLFGYSINQFMITGHYTFVSGVFPVWFLLIIAPFIEELGWHTYGTDVLRNKLNLFWTSISFAFYWGIWHIPLSGIVGYYQSNLVETGWIYGVNFLVSIFPFVIIINWLYYKTNRNIMVPIIFHITAGYFNEIFATNPDSKIIQTILLFIFATFIVLREKNFFFEK